MGIGAAGAAAARGFARGAAAAAVVLAVPAAVVLAMPAGASADPPYALPATLSVRVLGAGTVVGPGISCPRRCAERFQSPTMLTLTARPAAGHYFTYWGGACWGERSCLVAMNGSQSVEALFVALPSTRITGRRLTGNRLTVRFGGSGGAGELQYRCRLDRGRSRTCASPARYAGLSPGRHVVTVQAIDSNSRTDRSPARWAFRVG